MYLTPSEYLLQDCSIPKRKGNTNEGLRNYAVSLYDSLKACNLDKQAIRKEMGL